LVIKDQVALWIDDSLSVNHYFADSYCSSNDTAAAVVVVAPVSPLAAVSNEWETSPNPAALPCVYPDIRNPLPLLKLPLPLPQPLPQFKPIICA